MVECLIDIIVKWNYVVIDFNGNSYCIVNFFLDICQNIIFIFNIFECFGNLLYLGNLVYLKYNVRYFGYIRLFECSKFLEYLEVLKMRVVF